MQLSGCDVVRVVAAVSVAPQRGRVVIRASVDLLQVESSAAARSSGRGEQPSAGMHEK